MKLRNLVLSAYLATAAFTAQAQQEAKAPDNWFNLDYDNDGVRGVSTEKAYEELLKGKKSTKIIVSIIDSGVDEEHEDLKDVMWVNEGEIAGNGIDDDNNGYIDDVHGWNFIGGKDGSNVNQDQLEITRLYVYLKDKKRNKKEEAQYQEIKKTIDDETNSNMQQIQFYTTLISSFEKIDVALDGKPFTYNNVEEVKNSTKDEKVTVAARLFQNMIYPQMEAGGSTKGDTLEIKELTGQLQGALDYYEGRAKYYYNTDFDPRSEIVKDDYMNSKEKYYGNNDVTGPDALHGTHVAGIVGASRGNDVGMDGVADNVVLMSVRTVPDGDERDKDVANAIRYSVDNGAKIINMSFGKGYKFDKKAVDKAVCYAQKKGVLLVHAAGNSHLDTDTEANYPNKYWKDKNTKKPFYNWIEVGALSWKDGADAPATFSNYGARNVDLFAPGVDIYSTTPDNGYQALNGTSMASPVVAGVAALVWSYYPELTVKELRQVLVESTIKVEGKVYIPGSQGQKEATFKDLSNTGGVVNAYSALVAAEKIVNAKKK